MLYIYIAKFRQSLSWNVTQIPGGRLGPGWGPYRRQYNQWRCLWLSQPDADSKSLGLKLELTNFIGKFAWLFMVNGDHFFWITNNFIITKLNMAEQLVLPSGKQT